MSHIGDSLANSAISDRIIQPLRSSEDGDVSNDELIAHHSESFARSGAPSLETHDKFHVAASDEDNRALLSQFKEDRIQIMPCVPTSSVKALKGTQETVMNSTNKLPETKLPFVKSSSMWQSIDAMEIFDLMPQRCPLEQYSVDFREGMAIGLMVTFANLADNVRKLSISDTTSTFAACLETLSNLEEHGFEPSTCSCTTITRDKIKDF